MAQSSERAVERIMYSRRRPHTGEVRSMSQPVILVALVVTFVCIWAATHPGSPRARRPDPRARKEGEQESDDVGDLVRRLREHEGDVARLRLAAAGRNRWDRLDLQAGVGPDSALGDEAQARLAEPSSPCLCSIGQHYETGASVAISSSRRSNDWLRPSSIPDAIIASRASTV